MVLITSMQVTPRRSSVIYISGEKIPTSGTASDMIFASILAHTKSYAPSLHSRASHEGALDS